MGIITMFEEEMIGLVLGVGAMFVVGADEKKEG